MMLMKVNQMRLEEIYSNNPAVCLDAVRRVKNCVIGSNRLKGLVLEQNVAERLVELMDPGTANSDIARESMLTVTSLAKGTESHVKILIDAGCIPRLLTNTRSDMFELVEASLRALRTIFKCRLAPIQLLYSPQPPPSASSSAKDSITASSTSSTSTSCPSPSTTILSHLFTLAEQNYSPANYVIKECIANIMAGACQTTEHQNTMEDLGAIQLVSSYLYSGNRNAYQVKLAALNLLAQLCTENETVSGLVTYEVHGGQSLLDMLHEMMSAINTYEMQFSAAKCMTCIYRSKAIPSNDPRLLYRTLPTLIFLCKKDKEPAMRAQAAEELASLIEVDVSLQKIASICDHLIPSLADMLRQSSPSTTVRTRQSPITITTGGDSSANRAADQFAPMEQQLDLGSQATTDEPMDTTTTGSVGSGNSVNAIQPTPMATSKPVMSCEEINIKNELRQAAFKVFASLGANDEDIRKRIVETDNIMNEIMTALTDPNLKVKLAALRCLHSLSRSVQQLRTLFPDHTVWLPLKTLLQSPTYEIIMLASSVLCNLLLEFSPSKQHFLDRFAIELLCNLTKRDDVQLRLNGAWALMNMAYQADESLKTQILNCLGIDQVFRLLSDSNVNILMKTLGLLRNLLSNKPHIDMIMQQHGKQIMPAVVLILEGEHSWEVKEQALCILVNIADGNKAKEFIMSNEDVLKKLTSYLLNPNVNLQSSAICCINNLIWAEDDGATQRQEKLRELAVPKILQQLLSTPHSTLFDRVKTALQQFNSTATGNTPSGGNTPAGK